MGNEGANDSSDNPGNICWRAKKKLLKKGRRKDRQLYNVRNILFLFRQIKAPIEQKEGSSIVQCKKYPFFSSNQSTNRIEGHLKFENGNNI